MRVFTWHGGPENWPLSTLTIQDKNVDYQTFSGQNVGYIFVHGHPSEKIFFRCPQITLFCDVFTKSTTTFNLSNYPFYFYTLNDYETYRGKSILVHTFSMATVVMQTVIIYLLQEMQSRPPNSSPSQDRVRQQSRPRRDRDLFFLRGRVRDETKSLKNRS